MNQLIQWQIATVAAIKPETAQVKTFSLALPNWSPHRAGQHYDVRLTAADGYQAQRSYSIASAPERAGQVDLTVERIPDGEVSTYLHDVLVPGDRLEVRGPIGGYFVWQESLGGPLLLVAGGSGVVPLRAMLRHHRAVGSDVAVRLLYSARTHADLLYRAELEGFDTVVTLTREQWSGHTGRVGRELLEEVGWPPADNPLVYVCGPTGFVEGVADALVALGHEPQRIRTERFGPT